MPRRNLGPPDPYEPFGGWLWVLALLLWVLVSTGCASLVPTDAGSRRAEIAWQVLNTADLLQTVQVARHPQCFEEGNAISRAIVGKHPSSGEAGALILAYGLGHARVSRWLDDRTTSAADSESPTRGVWYVGRIVWHVAGLVNVGATVNNNFQLGVTPTGAKCGK